MRQGVVPALLLAALLLLLAIVEAIGAAEAIAGDAPWADYVIAANQAVAVKDARGATWALGHAFNAAKGSRGWDGLLVVGDAALRAGRALDLERTTLPQARRAYMMALLRARDAGAIDGVLRACHAFATIGDRQVVERCVDVAEGLATRSRDSRALAEVRAVAERLTDRSFAAGGHRIEP